MPKFNPKTTAQIRRMFGLGKPLGCGKAELEELAFDVTNGRVSNLSRLSFDEANGVIKRLGGTAFPVSSQSRRAVQYRRQEAGVDQIVSEYQLNKLNSVWFAKTERTAQGLIDMCQRVIHLDKPRTTKECSKVIEAIKSMNKRAGVFGAFKKEKAA